jgi:formyltetrahydrofolate-dependent phosphoribosylglycinamide formyltransferase
VVSSSKKAYGLERAKKENIETTVFRNNSYNSLNEAGEALLKMLKDRKIDYIALAGYLKLVPKQVIKAYRNRIVNIHPALLPKYGGKGMYGHFVHEAVLASGDKESGPSIHLVTENYDEGKVLEQIRVPVLDDDTVESLAERVLAEEHKLYPRVLEKLIKGEYNFADE